MPVIFTGEQTINLLLASAHNVPVSGECRWTQQDSLILSHDYSEIECVHSRDHRLLGHTLTLVLEIIYKDGPDKDVLSSSANGKPQGYAARGLSLTLQLVLKRVNTTQVKTWLIY